MQLCALVTQHALRLTVFRQFYRVLGMDPPSIPSLVQAKKRPASEGGAEAESDTATTSSSGQPESKKVKLDEGKLCFHLACHYCSNISVCRVFLPGNALS